MRQRFFFFLEVLDEMDGRKIIISRRVPRTNGTLVRFLLQEEFYIIEYNIIIIGKKKKKNPTLIDK